ncbi:MAG: hypothetical protein LBL36_02545, partial [Clostridiales Family XIII bacterium]|nr:hypothetical protein [Clostridiales Family XIII bacterium]
TAYAAARGVSLFGLLSDESVTESLPGKSAAAMRRLVTLLAELSGRSAAGGEAVESDVAVPAEDDAQPPEPVTGNTDGETMKISDLYDSILVRSGYVRELEAAETVEAEGRIENLLEFKSVILQEEQMNPLITLPEFMEKLALIADIDNHDRDENAVTLMTLHSAKGLAFPVVFRPGMEEGLFPGTRAMDSLGGLEEERRLCYVGMTRARERLYLIRAKSRTMYGRFEHTLESCFLREIDTDTLDGAEKIGKDTTGYFHKAMGADDGFAEAEVIRPFDQLARIKNEVRRGKSSGKSSGGSAYRRNEYGNTRRNGAAGAAMQNGPGTEYNKGDKVRHSKFGDGLIIDADARTITVMFDGEGKKKLARGMAPLEKI